MNHRADFVWLFLVAVILVIAYMVGEVLAC